MRIVSRIKGDEVQHERIRDMLESVTDGEISLYGPTQPGDTLEDLVGQVEDVFVDQLQLIENLEENYTCLQQEAISLAVQVGMQEKALSVLSEGVHYDEALDFATIDLIDALLGSGAANVTYSGDLSFDENVTFTKEDLKPILRQAIDTWVCNKVR